MGGHMRLKQLVGLADACELLSVTWTFPDGRLAAGVADGSFMADALGCLVDAGVCDSAALDEMCVALSDLKGADPADVLAALRREHSRLFLVAGADPAVWPYETAFRYRAAGGEERRPALFGSPTMHDVEHRMKAAGVAPAATATEPVDSVWNEFAFLAYLYGGYAQAVGGQQGSMDGGAGNAANGDAGDPAAIWRGRIADFYAVHAAMWLPAFMGQVIAAAHGTGAPAFYRGCALLGQMALAAMDADAKVGV